MTTASDAFEVVKGLLRAARPAGLVALRWPGDDGDDPIPDNPAPWAYTELLTERVELASFGGGRGNNRYRNHARLVSYILVPRVSGLKPATDLAEQVAAIFRSYRDASISVFEATVYPGGDGASLAPPGLSSEVRNYFWASMEATLFYDLIG